MFELFKSSHFIRDFNSLEPDIQEQILLDIKILIKNPFKNSIKLEATKFGKRRIRSGNYRIRYDVEHKKIILHSVKHRKDAYKDI